MPVAPASSGRAPGARVDRGYELFLLWCEVTGQTPRAVPVDEVAAFLGRPEVRTLARVPDEVLRDAAGAARRGAALPLERWLAAVRIVRPHA
ncbi:MAG TPA: hypothetical protein VGN37_14000 [Actinocatenispora sp.]